MAMAVHYVLNQNYKNIELIVSDNSTSFKYREKNRLKLKDEIRSNKLRFIGPPQRLSAPEHFEFALQYATGDYVLFLTDKMAILPNTLEVVAKAIKESSAEIINWTYSSFITDDYLNPRDSGGTLGYPTRPKGFGYKKYDPLKHLKLKSSGRIPRGSEGVENYIKGKICFGCFSRKLISKIIRKSGALYGGTTHDYSAMVQALCLSPKSIILDNPGIVFIAIPCDKSWGPLTYFKTAYALKYYREFTNYELVLDSLFIPGLYASQHNMVAHDYIKYLTLYGKRKLFVDKFWLRSIFDDLNLTDKVWKNESERRDQHALFFAHFNKILCAKIYYYCGRFCDLIPKSIKQTIFLRPILRWIRSKKMNTIQYTTVQCESLGAAVKIAGDQPSQ